MSKGTMVSVEILDGLMEAHRLLSLRADALAAENKALRETGEAMTKAVWRLLVTMESGNRAAQVSRGSAPR